MSVQPGKALQKHNKTSLSKKELEQVPNKTACGEIFEKANIPRDNMDYIKDDGAVVPSN